MAVLIDAVVFSEDVVRHEITNGAKGKIDVTVAPKIISTQVICIYPGSYTHLDVYKRQMYTAGRSSESQSRETEK